jgi:D-3-phosphoglycerate dehydrogenase
VARRPRARRAHDRHARHEDVGKLRSILLTHSPETLAQYYGERALAGLRVLGEVKLHRGNVPLEGEALIAAAADCDLIVSYRQSPAPAALFERLPGLVAFLRCAVDIRNVDVAAASRAGVLVTQASAGFAPAVGELVLGFLVDLSRGISRAAADYHAGRVPRARMGRELRGSTLGILGYGAIGREVARAVRALGMRVLVNDPYVRGIEQTPLDALLAESDYVVPLAVATPETENLMDDAAFAKMKPGAFLINVSRGNLVDEAALARALDSGRLRGCALDVGRAPDQMPTPALAARADVIATPHTAGLTLPAIEHQSLETVAQAAEILKRHAPKGAVNAEHWKRKGLLKP